MAAVIPRASEAAQLVGWRRFLALWVLFAVVVVLYWPAVEALGQLWADSARTTYTHGYLVAAISLWLIWRARRAIASPEPDSPATMQRLWTTAALLATALAWQLAYRAGIQLAAEALLLPLCWLAVLALFGRHAARATLLPVAFLVFALPVWEVFTAPLQFATVQATRMLLAIAGVPAFIQGNVVEIPAGTFEVEGGCSGLHFFIVALCVTALLGELRRDPYRRRLWWLFLGASMAVLVNWLRVSSIIYVGHVSHMQNYLVRESHYGYGWVLFGMGLLALLLIERRTALGRISDDAPVLTPPLRSADTAYGWRAAAVVIIAVPALLNVMLSARLAEPRAPAIGIAANESGWRPIQLNADRESRERIVRDGMEIESYEAQYREQRLGKKLGGAANSPYGDAQVLDGGTVSGDSRFAWRVLDLPAGESLLVYTYQVDGRQFASATRAQLWYAWRTFATLRSPDSRLRAWRVSCLADCDRARALLEKAIAEDGFRS